MKNLSTKVNPPIEVPTEIPDMFISSTNHFARVMDSVPSPPHLYYKMKGMAAAPSVLPTAKAALPA